LLLVEVGCRWCGKRFYVCRRCWRGQAYCCEECRRLGRQRVHREAQRRYRQILRGKKAHRQGENRRRHGWSKKNEKKMDDLSSKGLAWCAIVKTWRLGVKAKLYTLQTVNTVGVIDY